MTAAIPVEESTIFISEFGPVPTETLDLRRSKHEVRLYRMSTDRTKQLGDALGFSAQFDSEEVFDAFADVWKDEGYITFEMKTNTRPMTISLRYKSDRWSAVETHTPNKRESEGELPKTRGVKTIYHAFLDATVLSRVAELLKIQPERLANLFFRINFKSKTYALVAADDAVENFPDTESFKTAIIPRKLSESAAAEKTDSDEGKQESPDFAKTTSEAPESDSTTDDTRGILEKMSDNDSTESVEDLNEDSGPAAELAEPAQEEPVVPRGSETNLIESKEAVEKPEAARPAPEAQKRSDAPTIKSFDATPSATPERAPMRAEPVSNKSTNTGSQAKYHTYSQSEVDNLIRRSAENVTSSVTTKINQQTKSVEKTLKNHEFALNQTIEKLTKQMEQANAKLDKASVELSSGSAKQVEEFRSQLNKELDDFRSNLDKKVLPGIKLLDARLEQLAEAKKQTQTPTQTQTIGGMTPGVLVGAVVAIAIVGVVNLVISWYAFERISNLEKSHAELMLKTVPSSQSDVPVPDLMKEQIEKEQKTTTPAPNP